MTRLHTTKEPVMDLTAVDPVWWIVIGAVLVVVVLGLLIWSWQKRRSRQRRLRRRFGPEYERVRGSAPRGSAESDLERRLDRRNELQLTDVAATDVDELDAQIGDLVPEFLWHPEESAREMSQIVERVAVARGYVAPDQGVLDLVSVDHPESVAHLRQALDDMDQLTGRDQHTEACRQVFLEARALAYQLVDDGRGIDTRYTGDAEDSVDAEAAMTDPSQPDADLDREPDTLRDRPHDERD
jgi:hypothetical protein